MRRSGSCLCGSVRFSGEFGDEIAACHCKQCQRWTGGGPFIVAKIEALEIEGEDKIAAHHASEWGERGFCGKCGSPIYWRMQGSAISSVAVGLLDDQSGLTLTEEIFVDTRPGWMQPVPGATQSTEAQEMAKLRAFQEGQST